jgi:hypothetical protein
LLQQLSDLKSELAFTTAQVTQQHATQQQLHAAFEAAEAHTETALQRATAAEAAAAAEAARSVAAEQQHKQALQEAKKEQKELLKQQQSLMDVLAQRDQRVSGATAKLQHTAGHSQAQLLCMHMYQAIVITCSSVWSPLGIIHAWRETNQLCALQCYHLSACSALFTAYCVCLLPAYQVAQLASDLQAAKHAAADTQHQAAHMEGILRSTGERAAAAEDSTRTQGELVVHLQEQLAQLKDRCGTSALVNA